MTPRCPEVELSSLAVGNDPAAERIGGFQHQLLGNLRHHVVVGVRGVELQHGEFRIVRGVDSLISEIAPDLIHLLDPADHETFEIELEGDPQIKVHVERVRVRAEGPGRRSTVQRLQHRRLDFDISATAKTAS